MPFGGLLTAGISSLVGGLAGMGNARPPSLNPAQLNSLNTVLPWLTQQGMATPKIDPIQQALMYSQIAQSGMGAQNNITHALVSRGLGRSGILGNALTQQVLGQQQQQNQANLGLQQQAFQRQMAMLGMIPNFLNVNSTPGQSPFGAFMAGAAPPLAYQLQSMYNNNQGQGNSGVMNSDGIPNI